MLYAIKNGTKVEPSKDIDAICPCCGSEVRAKMGERNIHHWSHVSKDDCSFNHKPETEWHKSWKRGFQPDCVEVVKNLCGRKVISDVSLTFINIEFQHSTTTEQEVQERAEEAEAEGKDLVWIIDGNEFSSLNIVKKVISFEDKEVIGYRYKWKNVPYSIIRMFHTATVFVHKDEVLYHLELGHRIHYLKKSFVGTAFLIPNPFEFILETESKKDSFQDTMLEFTNSHLEAIKEVTRLRKNHHDILGKKVRAYEKYTKKQKELREQIQRNRRDIRDSINDIRISRIQNQNLLSKLEEIDSFLQETKSIVKEALEELIKEGITHI